MRLTNQLVSLLAVFFVATVAYSQDVHYNYARGTNFSAYKTYQWVDVPGRGGPPKMDVPGPDGPPKIDIPEGRPFSAIRGSEDQLISQDIKRAVDEQLAQKGLTKVENNADLQVAYRAAIHEEKAINLWDMGGAGPGGWGG